jgi:peptide chain release factor 1
MSMYAKLDAVEERYESLNEELSQPQVASDVNRYRDLMKEYTHVRKVVEAYRSWKELREEFVGAKEMLAEGDDDLREMVKAEIAQIEPRLIKAQDALKVMLLPPDPNEGRDLILEIRAGVGGDEAGLFASDLFRMYMRYGDGRRWKFDVLNTSYNAASGFKEVIVSISGSDAWTRLRYEAGVHRVQRVPSTETQGRIHTSTCTVALMPEPEEVEVDLAEKDVRIDRFRASGPGGQSVNTTDSAIRLTHIPTGMIVQCQDEKSQHKNREKAFKVLRARLYEKQRLAIQASEREVRLGQVGTGDRSERIRTYNFPQGRVTDHRIGATLYTLDKVIEGDLDDLLDRCGAHFEALTLQQAEG